MPKLLLTRPEGQNEEWQELLSERGLESITSPLLHIEHIADQSPVDNGDSYQAMIITSKQSLKSANSFKKLTLFVVGEQLAIEANKLGFANIGHIAPTAEALASFLSAQTFERPLLYLAGAITRVDIPALLAPYGIAVEMRIVYDAKASDCLSPKALEAIRNDALDGVLLFSVRSAEVFHSLARRADLQKHVSRLSAFCLSQEIADTCANQQVWRAIYAPASPGREGLLSLIAAHYGK